MKLSNKKVSSMIPSEIRSEINKIMKMLDELWCKKSRSSYVIEREVMLENRLLELETTYPISLENTLDKTFVRNMTFPCEY